MTQIHPLDRPASYWDGPARKAARAKNPNADELNHLDLLIESEEHMIEMGKQEVFDLRKQKAQLFNDQERACNLFGAIASWTESENTAKAMTIEQLAEKVFAMGRTALEEAVISEILTRAGYVYKDEEIRS